MTTQQVLLALIFVVMSAAFIAGRLRLDVIAVAGLLAAVAVGAVSPEAAFSGLGNPAVVAVAAVLILTRAVHDSRVLEPLTARIAAGSAPPAGQLTALCAAVAVASTFMNNIGALALFMPAALEIARRQGLHPGFFLLSLSYAALLGGMVSLIGTPANLLVSGFRAEATGTGFSFIAFAAVGAPLASAGVIYLAWRGRRRAAAAVANDADDPPAPTLYDVELTVAPGSPLIGEPAAIPPSYGAATVYGVVRNAKIITCSLSETIVAAGDVLLTRASSPALQALTAYGGATAEPALPASDEALVEVVVAPNALMQGSCAASLALEERFGVRLTAAARQGRPPAGRLADAPLSLGDVLLLRGAPARIADAAAELGCLPLAERGPLIQTQNRWFKPVWLIPAVFILAVAAAAFDLTSPAVALVAGVSALALTGALRPVEIYRAVDWQVIVLLAAMLPLGAALQDVGLAALMGGLALKASSASGFAEIGPAALVAVFLAVSMLLTPFLNNPAVAAATAPAAIAAAQAAGMSPDPLLMAVAVGASCDFLTPFGHHNNALVMGPGGYRFGDYARLGWGLELLALIGGTALIVLIWT